MNKYLIAILHTAIYQLPTAMWVILHALLPHFMDETVVSTVVYFAIIITAAALGATHRGYRLTVIYHFCWYLFGIISLAEPILADLAVVYRYPLQIILLIFAGGGFSMTATMIFEEEGLGYYGVIFRAGLACSEVAGKVAEEVVLGVVRLILGVAGLFASIGHFFTGIHDFISNIGNAILGAYRRYFQDTLESAPAEEVSSPPPPYTSNDTNDPHRSKKTDQIV